MAHSIYITSAEGHSGKSSVALGVLDTLLRTVERVGVFRPVARSTAERDFVLDLLLARDGVALDYDDCVGVSYEEVHEDPDAALSRIVDRFKAIERQCDAVVIVGSDYTDVATPTELAYNARINLHVNVEYGRDPHHITEAEFKALARALREATERDPRITGIPSTKGAL